MLEYEKQIFLDILQEDGLVVIAKGLGLDSVIISLLKVYCDPGNLVFVLGAEGKHQEWLLKNLQASGVTPQPKVVSFEMGVSERQQSYLDGGLWFVPNRILVVDMIKKRIPIDLITGFIVCKAHNILKNHQDAFVLRLFRQGNKTGFIKAFSDQAASFRGGFNKVEQIMKALFVRTLLLWPRYHSIVKSSLNKYKPTVVELHLEMSKKMIQLQNALLDLIKGTVQELKGLNPALDSQEVTVENVISESLHKNLQSQLEPVWHALSERTKALSVDLKLFHQMIWALLIQDSVSFYSFVNSQKSTQSALKGSGWHFLPASEILFTTARERVFPKPNTDTLDLSQMDAEPHPKWLVLSEVLAEIHREYAKEEEELFTVPKKDSIESKLEDMFNSKSSKENSMEEDKEDPADILILTRDERNCSQLQTYLTLGSKELLNVQFRKCFSLNMVAKKGNEPAEPPVEKTGEKESDDQCDENEEVESDTYTLSLNFDGFSKLEGDIKVNIAGYFEDSLSTSQKNALLTEESLTVSTSACKGKRPPVIVIKAYRRNLMDMPQILEEQKPRWIVIYDPEMTLVRQIEVYQRNHLNLPVKVYFLVFGGTVEEQAYLTSLRVEKEAFDFLIQEKARVVIPADISDYPELCQDATNSLDLLDKTRKGGLESPKKGPSKIIVDMREFRSELPALIHSRGIEIEPLTITIGDYVLTPDICLERKSISDLIQSLKSGRLYKQATEMARHYARPMLLIEFDKNKPFDLQDRYYFSTDSSSEDLISKLQLLTLHFPQLRLIWSPHPLATAQLFEELKQGHPDPDTETVLALGVDQTATDEDKFNPGIQKMLSNLPGVTNKNIYSILLNGKSLDNLQQLSKEEISELIQNSVEGEALYNSIHESCNADAKSSVQSSKSKSKSRGFGRRKRFH